MRNISKEQSYLQLFFRECISAPAMEVDELDQKWLNSDEYKEWLGTKSDITLAEVIESVWIKSCTAGYVTEVHFASDGTLNEYKLFDRLATTGHWTLNEGVLRVAIQKGDNQYQFGVIGSHMNSIYSAIEYKNDQLHSYLKLMPTRAR